MKNCRYQNGSLPPVGKPPKPETIVVIKPLSLSEKSLVFGEQERPQRCGDQNRCEQTRIWTGLVTPYRIDLQNK